MISILITVHYPQYRTPRMWSHNALPESSSHSNEVMWWKININPVLILIKIITLSKRKFSNRNIKRKYKCSKGFRNLWLTNYVNTFATSVSKRIKVICSLFQDWACDDPESDLRAEGKDKVRKWAETSQRETQGHHGDYLLQSQNCTPLSQRCSSHRDHRGWQYVYFKV